MSYEQLAEALAFCGNSLLSPMTQTSSIGLDPSFWRNFPAFDDERVAAATEGLAQWTKRFGEGTEGKDRKSTRLNSSHVSEPRMPSSA